MIRALYYMGLLLTFGSSFLALDFVGESKRNPAQNNDLYTYFANIQPRVQNILKSDEEIAARVAQLPQAQGRNGTAQVESLKSKSNMMGVLLSQNKMMSHLDGWKRIRHKVSPTKKPKGGRLAEIRARNFP